ncbi:hypothetical protein RP726_16270 [Candidatus Methylospira mobilis]|nr:hypothetical protein [Candidatus Methylospira mobilis]WNV03969.1 hypothetical protein RP726_16270 [Candidatus Methylospira mobilis]
MNIILYRSLLLSVILSLSATACGSKGPLVPADSAMAATMRRQEAAEQKRAEQKELESSNQKSSQPSQLQPSPF